MEQIVANEFCEWVNARVESRNDVLVGEPCFRGTRLAVRCIGQLAADGHSHSSILEWYPQVTSRDVQFAELFYRQSPRSERASWRTA